ncbi:hypothetical protein HWV62_22157 [Athelia sp. TMB]|nr:hypothetical protein HWV62_22157 [Athelia sp. TMB]
MDTTVVEILKEGSILSLVNELIVHRDLAASRGESELVQQSVETLDILQCTVKELERNVRDLEYRLAVALKDSEEKELAIEQFRRDVHLIQNKEEDLEAASKTIKTLTSDIEELRETMQEAEDARILCIKKAQARQETIFDLQVEIDDSSVAIARGADLLEAVNFLRPPFVHLPQEIVHEILTQAVCPSTFIDPVLYPGLTGSAWHIDLRTRKALSLVCKTWRSIGLALLYEAVFILRIGQIPLLRRALDSDSSRGELIKSIDVSCQVPYNSCPPHTRQELLRIFQLSPNLISVTFGVSVPLQWHEPRGSWMHFLTRFETTHSLMANSSYLVKPNAAYLVKLLESCRSLKTLNLWIEACTDEIFPPLTLNSLETLRLTTEDDKHQLKLYHAIAEAWSMPSLKNLILYEMGFEWDDGVAALRQSFFARYGSGIRYLHLKSAPHGGFGYSLHAVNADVQAMLKHCPNLEHLVLSIGNRSESEYLAPLSHLNVKWIDLWKEEFCPDASTQLQSTTPAFPKLQRMRRLDGRSDGLPAYTDWPSVFPPWTELEGSEPYRDYLYSGIIIRQTTSSIYRLDTGAGYRADMTMEDLEDPDYNSSDDSSYIQSEEESRYSFYSDDEAGEIDYDTGCLFSPEETESAQESDDELPN